MILHKYFAKRFLFSFVGTGIIFLLILALLDLVEQLRRYGQSDASFGEIAHLTLLNIPQGLYQILPLIIILASIALFLSLARNSEMVVTRAAGRSALNALVSPLIMALIIGILGVAIMNPIVAATSRQYEERSEAIKGETSILALGSSGLWLRQGNAIGQTVIRAQSANLDGTELQNVTFISFPPTGGPLTRVAGASAKLTDGAWVVADAKEWPLAGTTTPEAKSIRHAAYRIPSTLTPDQIRDNFGTPSSIPIWELPGFINRLETAGFSAQRHLVWFHSELAMPAFLAAMVMIGASFTIRHQRGGRTGLMVLLAVLLAFSIYFLRNFALILGENGELPPILAAWAPPLVAISLSLGMLLHNEDG